MRKSEQDKINENLDTLNFAKEHLNKASKRVNKRIQKLTGATSPILDIYKQCYNEQLETTRKNLR